MRDSVEDMSLENGQDNAEEGWGPLMEQAEKLECARANADGTQPDWQV